ncbi:ATP-binding protein [Sphaerisporangium corydalis]|uniref:histidine kinase n=1 Tax=Sphaerisporangium corydalis TaxID=1441875 RepID=A0ABV9E6U7_9ACTN|nr:ATP-binding protein [Sphaerisporangium corydalis]
MRTTRPPLWLGIVVGVSCVLLETALNYVIMHVAPAPSLGVIYLLGVLLIATVWGLPLALATGVASTFAFHYFFLRTMNDSTELVVLPTFVIVALLASSMAGLARSATLEVFERRTEADLAAEQARLLLCARDVGSALPKAAERLARALDLPYATIRCGPGRPGEDEIEFPLRMGDEVLGALIVPQGMPVRTMRRLRRRTVPGLEALLAAAHERELIGNALEASHAKLRQVADRQAALRRVATLVARGVSPNELFYAIATEMGRIVDAVYVVVTRFETDRHMTVAGSWSDGQVNAVMRLGSRWTIGEGTTADLVSRTGRPCRATLGPGVVGGFTDWGLHQGLTSAVGCPIVVEGRQWGAVIAFCSTTPPSDAEVRMQDFTALAATAIANAENLAQLAASRARVVAAIDDTRRRIERDLHDGTQQHLVSLGLELRRAAIAAPSGATDLKDRLDHALAGLADIMANLREIARGLHPAILSMGGLEPALRSLARRSGVPVELTMHGVRRLAERVEAAVYFTVSEALTNVAKHAHASVVDVELDMDEENVTLSIRDDGIGGSDAGHGSGLIGLKDRVEALGGTIDIVSPHGGGTAILTRIPTGRG